jgi:hypothetical protein
VRGNRWAVLAVVLAAVLSGCGGSAVPRTAADHVSPSGSASPPSPNAIAADVAMTSPGPLTDRILSPDILVFSSKTLQPAVVARIRHVPGVSRTERFAMAQFYYQENPVQYAAVDPSTFRRWTLDPVAQSTAVWKRVADGEIAIAPGLGKRIETRASFVHLGDSHTSPSVHVGAYAGFFSPTTNLGINAVVNERWVKPLGMVPDNAMLVSTGRASPQSIERKLRTIVGGSASIRVLGFTFDPKMVQTAVLTGEAVNGAVGTYNYTATAGGQVTPEAAWVRTYIRTEQVPILGAVTCNKVMLPQLIGALTQLQRAGLAGEIHTYNGCFVPRYIAGSHQLSYHAFGLAIDIDAATNQRGTRGTMDPRVVSIFREWGFEWGGAWHYTDPMHFQLDRVVNGRPQSDP